jgi:hypothetical protein
MTSSLHMSSADKMAAALTKDCWQVVEKQESDKNLKEYTSLLKSDDVLDDL